MNEIPLLYLLYRMDEKAYDEEQIAKHIKQQARSGRHARPDPSERSGRGR